MNDHEHLAFTDVITNPDTGDKTNGSGGSQSNGQCSFKVLLLPSFALVRFDQSERRLNLTRAYRQTSS